MTDRLPATADGLARAASLLRDGAVVAFPTDTVYGVACAPERPDALARLVGLKGRPESKPIPILAADASAVEEAGYVVSEVARRLAARWWPGALTLILPARDGGPSQAFRVPDHPIARDLLRATGPLLVTSANVSDEPETLDADEVLIAFATSADQLAAVVDGGPVPGGTASSVVDLTTDPPTLLREGAISRAALAEVVDLGS